MKIIVWISRIFVGVLFIISGLIKANDPLGFSYKLKEYYDVFGGYDLLQFFDNAFFHSTALEFSMFICIVEIVLGVALIIGAFPRIVAWTLLLMILFFTFLTGFSAITGKVTDCGCFGDAVKLTPWESFYKDLVLLIFIGIIFIYRNRIQPLFSRTINFAVIGVATAACLIFTIMAYQHLPFKDFRPYKVGNNICELMIIPEDAPRPVYETTLIYTNKKTGEEQEFTMQEFMDQKIGENADWEWKDTKSVLVEKGFEPKIKNFRISNLDGEEVTDGLLQNEGLHFYLVMYNLDNTRTKNFDKINQLQQKFEEYLKTNDQYHEYAFVGLTSSGAEAIEEFRHENQTAFPVYVADETELKTIIRANPGLLLLDGCKVVGKWHWRDIPDFEAIRKDYNL